MYFLYYPIWKRRSIKSSSWGGVTKIEEVLSKGYKEIIFTGVDLTSYGNDLPGKPTLGNLIRRLIKLHPSIERLRLSSIDPAEVDGELMDLLKFEPRLMPHIHLSVNLEMI